MEQGRVVEALAELQRTYRTLPDHWRDDRAAADYHAALGSGDKALEALTRALRMSKLGSYNNEVEALARAIQRVSDRRRTQIEHLAQTALGCASCHWVAGKNQSVQKR